MRLPQHSPPNISSTFWQFVVFLDNPKLGTQLAIPRYMMQLDRGFMFSSGVVGRGTGSTTSHGNVPTVYIVDDDHFLRRAWQRTFDARGLEVLSYAEPRSFLEQLPQDAHGCVLLDVNMLGMNGLDVQKELTRRGCHMPIIFITACNHVATVVEAMKCGAFHFFPKPVDPAVICDVVFQAIAYDRDARMRRVGRQALMARATALTPREMDVARLVALGMLNKQIAGQLGITEKTVKVHRARAMIKLHVDSVANLVRIIDTIHGIDSAGIDAWV